METERSGGCMGQEQKSRYTQKVSLTVREREREREQGVKFATLLSE